MSGICIIDTSIFLELIDVPGKARKAETVRAEMELKIRDGEVFFLPMATILETGKHIAQNGKGSQRRKCAERFVHEVMKALDGESPFQPINSLEVKQLRGWLDDFPDYAMRKYTLADVSIIHDYNRICALNRRTGRTVYIWSLDEHLKSFSTTS